MGIIYSNIIAQERTGTFLGSTVQVVPHVTNEIKKQIYDATKEAKPDIHIIEIGGTVGEIESQTFLEAIRQIQLEVGRENCLFVHTTLLPYLSATNELKTKPTQHSVKSLMGVGIIPNFLVLRADRQFEDDIKDKIAKLCTINKENIIALPDIDNIYKVPMVLHEQNLDNLICSYFKINKKPNLTEWINALEKYNKLTKKTTIAVVGKYTELEDAYLSVKESIKHAALVFNAKAEIKWINSEDLNESNIKTVLKNVNGMIVPGGFGNRGIEGKICAIKFAREKNIPFLGICLGMQLAIVEFARNVAKIKNANSTEFCQNTDSPVIDYLPEQYKGIKLGGTMRLGAYDCHIEKGTLAFKAYGTDKISERHRHRYEFNNKYLDVLKQKGLIFSGFNKTSNLAEIVELKIHKHFIACQFHPEFKSRLIKPHPLFVSLVKASL